MANIPLNLNVTGTQSLRELKEQMTQIGQATDNTTQSVTEMNSATDQTSNSAASLKRQLRELKEQLQQLEPGTAEFNEMAQRAGQLEDRIGDVNQRVRNLANDTPRLAAFTEAATGIAGGFAAAQGAIALFGDENEELNQILLKVQGSMALLQGVQAVANALNKDSALSTLLFSRAQNTAAVSTGGLTGAIKAMTVAMLANPVVLITAGIIALGAAIVGIIAYWDDLKKAAIDAFSSISSAADMAINKIEQQIRAQQRERMHAQLLNSEIAKKTRLLQQEGNQLQELRQQITARYDAEIAAARASGRATEHIEAEKREALKKTLRQQVENMQNQIDNAIDIVALQRGVSRDQAEILIQQDRFFGEVLQGARARITELNNELGNIVDAEKKAAQKIVEEQKSKNQKILEDAKARAEQEKAIQRKLEDEQIALIRDDAERKRKQLEVAHQRELEDLKQAVEQKKITEEQFNDFVLTSKKRLNAGLNELYGVEVQEFKAKEKEKLATVVEVKERTIEQKLEEANKQIEFVSMYVDAASSLTESLFTITNNLGNQSEKAQRERQRRQFNIQKAVSVVEAGINTAQAVTKAIAQFGPPPSPLGIAGIATAGVIGAAQIAAILSKRFDGGAGGASSVPSIGSSAIPIPPPPNGVAVSDSTRLNREQIERGEQQIKVFVTETDITSTQNQVNTIRERATIR